MKSIIQIILGLIGEERDTHFNVGDMIAGYITLTLVVIVIIY